MQLTFRTIFILCFIGNVHLNQSRIYAQTKAEQNQLQVAIKKYQQGELEAACTMLKVLANTTKNTTEAFQLQVHNNLGNVYADLGKNKDAVNEYTRALSLANSEDNALEAAKIRKNLGAVFMSLGRFKQAETYYLQALKTAKSEKNSRLEADCLNNLGTVYEQTSRLNEAKKSYFGALSIYRSMNDFGEIAMVSSNVAIVCKAKKEIDSCLYYNMIALQAATDLKDTWMEAAIANNIGNLYGELGNIEQARRYLTRSLRLSQEIKALEIEIMTLESFADAYARVGDHEKAFEYLKRMQKRQNAFNNLALSKEIEALNVRFQSKEKDLLAAKLKSEKQTTIWVASLIIICLIGFSLLVFLLARKRIREKHLLKLTEATLTSETNTRIALASDLHDNIGQKIAVLSMYTHHITDLPTQEKLKGFIQDLGHEVRGLSHQLVPEAFKFGLERSLQELKQAIESSTAIAFHLFCEPELFTGLPVITNLNLYRIIQETVSNTLKHAQATEINLNVQAREKHLTITISDNGRGFDTKKMKESKGIGWKTIEARTQAINGSFQLQSSAAGTIVTIKLLR